MERKLKELLELSKEQNADFLGLRARLRASSAENTSALDEDWLENTAFSVSCTAEISYTRELGDRMNSKGGQ